MFPHVWCFYEEELYRFLVFFRGSRCSPYVLLIPRDIVNFDPVFGSMLFEKGCLESHQLLRDRTYMIIYNYKYIYIYIHEHDSIQIWGPYVPRNKEDVSRNMYPLKNHRDDVY